VTGELGEDVCRDLVVEGAQGPGNGKKTWQECVDEDTKQMGLRKCDALDRTVWRNRLISASNEKRQLAMIMMMIRNHVRKNASRNNNCCANLLQLAKSCLSATTILRTSSFSTIRRSSLVASLWAPHLIGQYMHVHGRLTRGLTQFLLAVICRNLHVGERLTRGLTQFVMAVICWPLDVEDRLTRDLTQFVTAVICQYVHEKVRLARGSTHFLTGYDRDSVLELWNFARAAD